MAHGPPIPLTAVSVNLDSAEFRAICDWPFADAYITRLLQDDIPQRVIFGNCSVWTYRDGRGSLVGFGTLDVSADCNTYTRGLSHPYIPLLAINPTIKSKGYGTSIVRHLIDEAALITSSVACYDVLLLDVYMTTRRPSSFTPVSASSRSVLRRPQTRQRMGGLSSSWAEALGLSEIDRRSAGVVWPRL